MHIKDVDINKMWQDTMGWNESDKSGRRFDDAVEEDFWRKTAPIYTSQYNLNNDTDLISLKLSELIGENKIVLEIGCGSGNFTVLMAKYAQHIIGVDASGAMLKAIRKRISDLGINNITTVLNKWEEYKITRRCDCIVSINSLYRIFDMEQALEKMLRYAKERIIIVRTIQRSFFHTLYQQVGIETQECSDYQLIPLMFWRRGIRANVEFLTYVKKKSYVSIEAALSEMEKELDRAVFTEKREALRVALEAVMKSDEFGIIIEQPRITVIIWANLK